jgi:hypothetical protein
VTDPVVLLAFAAVPVVFATAWAATYRPWRRTPPPTWLDDAMRTRLLVQTRDGQTLDGSLVRVDADGIVLHPATYGTEKLAGEVWVARERVAWVQRPDAS